MKEKYVCDIKNNGCIGYCVKHDECISLENCVHKHHKVITLDEAIKHLEESIIYYSNNYGLDNKQLAEWLKELKERRARDNE